MCDTFQYNQFIEKFLMPAALKNLKAVFDIYISGGDIGLEIKMDDTPASIADRTTEEIMRNLIQSHFPDHGIWGEEYGAYQTDSDYIWVLDPLDGTREFLKKEIHNCGSLVGLLYKGRAVAGAVGNLIDGEIFFSNDQKNTQPQLKTICCTNVVSMFGKDRADILFEGYNIVSSRNCMGFVNVMKGEYEAAVEQDLSLHDIIALLPALDRSGLHAFDLRGNNYKDKIFNVHVDVQDKFSIVTSFNKKTVNEMIDRYSAWII